MCVSVCRWTQGDKNILTLIVLELHCVGLSRTRMTKIIIIILKMFSSTENGFFFPLSFSSQNGSVFTVKVSPFRVLAYCHVFPFLRTENPQKSRKYFFSHCFTLGKKKKKKKSKLLGLN